MADTLYEDQLTLADIARMADTSSATVSRVLSGTAYVSPELHERVMGVVERTGYVRDSAASSLGRRRAQRRGMIHGAIAVAMSKVNVEDGHTLSYLRQMIYEGVIDSAGEEGVAVTLLGIREEYLLAGRLPAGFPIDRVDGLLLHPSRGYRYDMFLDGPPAVMIGSRPYDNCGFPVAEADNAIGIDAIVGRLCELGHRRIEFACRDYDHLPFVERAEFFEAAARRLGVHATLSEPVGKAVDAYARAIAARPPETRPTALVGASDGVAAELLRELAEAGLRTPRDVSVVGFDGFAWGRETSPPLTSWRPDWHAVGAMAFSTLMDRIAGRPTPTRVLAGGELIVRGSAAPPPNN